MRTGYLVDEHGNNTLCECGCHVFHFSRGTKKRNKHETEFGMAWEEKSYYITRCAECGKRTDATIQDWHRVQSIKSNKYDAWMAAQSAA